MKQIHQLKARQMLAVLVKTSDGASKVVFRADRQVAFVNATRTEADGTRQLIADFKADDEGKGAIDPQLKFFEAGFVRVEIQRAS